MKNELARELSLAEGKIQYDNSVKRVLANKRILAWILKYVTEEFAGMSVDEIKTCIGSDIEISEIGVLPGRTNRREMEKIRGEAQEDAVPGEGELSFDIRFSAYLRGKKERIKLLINVEAQKNFYPGYSLTTRGVFYGARMISAQKGTEFAGSDYDKIRKVYSIWICLNAESKNGNPLTRMLGVLLSPKLKAQNKIRQLEEEFAIPMENKEIGEELNQMCNLSDYVEELGIQKGLEQGKERLLRLQIEKKLAKGLSLPEIADALEEKEETIRKMIGAIKYTTE